MSKALEKYRALIYRGRLDADDERQAASALKKAGPEGVKALIAGFRIGTNGEFCTRTLVEMGAPALPGLIGALRFSHNSKKMNPEEYINMKEGVVQVLGKIGGREAAEALAVQILLEPAWANYEEKEPPLPPFLDTDEIENIGYAPKFISAAKECKYDRAAAAEELLGRLDALGENEGREAKELLLKLGAAGGEKAVDRIFEYDKKGGDKQVGEIALRLAGISADIRLLEYLGKPDCPIRSWRWAAKLLMETGPRDSMDMRRVEGIAVELKRKKAEVARSGKIELVDLIEKIKTIRELYSKWNGVLERKADALVLDKGFHVPRVGKPDKVERIMRVRRVCA